MDFTTIIPIAVGGVVVIGGLLALSMYRIVPPSHAHYVVTPHKTMIVCSDPDIEKSGLKVHRWYFYIPIIRQVRVMDITIKEVIVEQETYEKNQARYKVKSSTKYRIKDVRTAAETFINDEALQQQLREVVNASVRAITVKYDVTEARAGKTKMEQEMRNEMSDNLKNWGLELVNFQLIDFQDTSDSKVISDISKRREVEIASVTRQQNAEKNKEARVKEAEAEEQAKSREISKEMTIAKNEQDKQKAIAEREKEAQAKRYEVIEVQTIKQAEIDKEKAIVKANQDKETEAINKDKKKLEGEGDRLRAEEQAKGEAAPIREKGFAEAEAKEKLQDALNKFDDNAIRALIAEKVVEMQKEIGVASAKALENADMKVFVGEDSKSAFDLGKMITALRVSNDGSANAVLNYLARPNDLGLAGLSLGKEKETPKDKTEKTTETKVVEKSTENKK